MKHTRMLIATALLGTLLALPAVTPAQVKAEVALRAAMETETVKGDLRGAIEQYKKLAQGGDRAVAAEALVRMGECHQKLGDAESRAIYERVVREFADQKEAAAEARTRLAALQSPASGVTPPGASATPSIRALPTISGPNNSMALSPDGTKMAVILYGKGQNVGVYDYGSKQTTLITNFGWTSQEDHVTYWAVWSADGTQVVYEQWAVPGPEGRPRINELAVTKLTGGSRVIYRNDANAGAGVTPTGWLRDGSAIVAVLQHLDKTFTLGLIPLSGGSFKPLRSVQWNPGAGGAASPDGQFIVFADGAAGAQDIYVIRTDGQSATRLTDHPADDSQPRWSPDGKHIVFISNRSGNPALWTIPVEGGKPAGEPFLIKAGMQGVELLNWTAHGLAYLNNIAIDDVFTMAVDPSTGQPTGKPQLVPFSPSGRNTSPVWSPDGKDFAFVSTSADNSQKRSVVVRSEGGRGNGREFLIPTEHFRNGSNPINLRWSPDGLSVSNGGLDSKGQPAVFTLRLSTGDWPTPTAPMNAENLEWKRDGTGYFYGDSVQGRIVERDLASGRERVVYSTCGYCVSAETLRLSRDGGWLAFFGRHATPGPEVTLERAAAIVPSLIAVNTQTGEVRQFASTKGAAPSWSPDGRFLLALRSDDGKSAGVPYIVPLGGGPAVKLDLPGVKAPITSTDWSPGGKQIAFMTSTRGVQTWLMENVVPVSGRSR